MGLASRPLGRFLAGLGGLLGRGCGGAKLPSDEAAHGPCAVGFDADQEARPACGGLKVRERASRQAFFQSLAAGGRIDHHEQFGQRDGISLPLERHGLGAVEQKR